MMMGGCPMMQRSAAMEQRLRRLEERMGIPAPPAQPTPPAQPGSPARAAASTGSAPAVASRARLHEGPRPRAAPMPDWPRALRVYPGTIALGDLAWEAAHLPLYTVRRTGTPGERAFAVVHCTGGDLLIVLACLALALVLAGEPAWPDRAHRRVAASRHLQESPGQRGAGRGRERPARPGRRRPSAAATRPRRSRSATVPTRRWASEPRNGGPELGQGVVGRPGRKPPRPGAQCRAQFRSLPGAPNRTTS